MVNVRKQYLSFSRAGMRDGQGIETFYTGEKYIGGYRADRRHGQV